jgi:predicted transcriptional regulator
VNNETIVRVADVMTQEFIMIDGLATVYEALAALEARSARCLIVEKRHEDDEFGIVTLADIARKVIARDRSPRRVNVYEIMSKPLISVRPKMNIRYTARMFDSFGLHLAPVLRRGKVLGIVSYYEIVKGSMRIEAGS